jgi:hypothetical protein
VGFWHVFEMPLLGYGGYIGFALEVYALYHLLKGTFVGRGERLVRLVAAEPSGAPVAEGGGKAVQGTPR